MRSSRSSSPWRSIALRRGIATSMALVGLALVPACSSLGLRGAAAEDAEPARANASGGSSEPGTAKATADAEKPNCVWWQPWCEKSQNVVPPRPPDPFWHTLVGKGRFKVRGSGMHDDGQQAYKRLRQEEALNAYLDCQGVPSFIEIVRVSHDAKPTADLIYRGNRTCGTVRVEPSSQGFLIARPIKPCPPPPPRGRSTSDDPPPPLCEATNAQQDECPFQEWRQDCQDLCKSCGTYPWCGN